MTRIDIATDNVLTSTDTAVDPEELQQRHGPATNLSAEGVIIGVQDSGVDREHEWIQQQTASITVDDYTGQGGGDAVGHGTMTADLATRYATGGNLLVHRIFGSSGSGASGVRKSLKRAIDLAKQDKLDVWNMSWGARQTVDWIDSLVNELAKAGCVPVAAAGNSGGATGSPATAKYCVSVSALQEGGERMTRFSSWDQDREADQGLEGVPDITAIGKNVIGARASGTSMGSPIDATRTKASGTSFSAPFVTNLVADLRRRQPTLSATEVVSLLEQSAVQIPGTHRDGLGRIDWASAVDRLQGGGGGTASATVWSLPWSESDWIQVDADALDDGEYTADLATLKDALHK